MRKIIEKAMLDALRSEDIDGDGYVKKGEGGWYIIDVQVRPNKVAEKILEAINAISPSSHE